MASIKLNDLEKWFDDSKVLSNINLTIRRGEFIVLVGPSGCGKSTLLRILAGLEDASFGSIEIDNEDVTDRLPSERGLAMVFQSYALYPHMDVAANMGFSLKIAGVAKSEIEKRVLEAADILRLGMLLDRLPKHLSGGQRQRVAIGRAIVRKPKVFLFDEPLSNLDASLRVKMRLEISRLQKHLEVTTIYVTHDQIEAMTLADRILVLNKGEIMQIGSPRDLYLYPKNKFVAEFIGNPKMNIARCEVGQGQLILSVSGKALSNLLTPKEDVAWFGIRPECVKLCDQKDATLRGTVVALEYLGSEQFIYVDCGSEELMIVRIDPATKIPIGTEVGMKFDLKGLHFFSASEERLYPS